MKPRLTQGKILQALGPVQGLIRVVHDARVRYRDCARLRPSKLASLSKYLKDLAALPHTSDYTPYERMLKRRLIRARHRVQGLRLEEGVARYALQDDLPPVYGAQVQAFEDAVSSLLRALADVSVEGPRVPLQTVAQIRAALSAPAAERG